MNPTIEYRAMTIDDYDAVVNLWLSTPGIKLRDSDSRSFVREYLKRNPGMSFVAHIRQQIIGVVMSGHDGRRGYIYHLTVAEDHRNNGIGQTLMKLATDTLLKNGILKYILVVMDTNEAGKKFWKSTGWNSREDLLIFDRTAPGKPNA